MFWYLKNLFHWIINKWYNIIIPLFHIITLPINLLYIILYSKIYEETEQLTYIKDKYGIGELAIKNLDKYFDFNKKNMNKYKDFNLLSTKFYNILLFNKSTSVFFYLKNFNIKDDLVYYYPNIKIKYNKHCFGQNNTIIFETNYHTLSKSIKSYIKSTNMDLISMICEYIFIYCFIKYSFNKYVKKDYNKFIMKSIQQVGM